MPACVLAAVAVLVPVLWVTGGFEEAPREVATAPGKAVDLGLFEVVVRDARIGTAAEQLGSARQRFLIVRLRVLNRGEETVSLGFGGLRDGVAARTKAGKWVKPDQMEGVAGGSKTDTTQPGLPVEVSAMWKLGPAEAPRRFTVGLREWKYDHGFTDDAYSWRVDLEDDALAGRMTLSVAAPTSRPRITSPRPRRKAATPRPRRQAATPRPRRNGATPRPTVSGR